MLELADRPVIGHASGLAGGFDPQIVCATQAVQDLENLGFPPLLMGFGDNPKPPRADTDLASHTSDTVYISVEVASLRMVRFSRRRYETRNPSPKFGHKPEHPMIPARAGSTTD